jgi:hexosaminidase
MIVFNSNAHIFELKVPPMQRRSLAASLVFLLTVPPALALLSPRSVAAQAPVQLLPAPREAQLGAPVDLPARIVVSDPGRGTEDDFAAADLEDAIKGAIKDAIKNVDASRPVAPAGPQSAARPPYRVVLLRTESAEARALLARTHLAFDPAMESEGYVLVLDAHGATIIGATGSGVFYGVQTFKQLLPLPGAPRAIPTGTIRDWPAMAFRGIDDDLSRGPFPTLDFQKHQIRVFASFKINIYSPYFEHTLLYPDHPLPAPPGSTLTPAEVAQLVAYARQYHVTIVPEQEAFGHLHHVLKYELYQDVAETPDGHVLAPGQPDTLPLIKDWFTDIAQEFPSPFIHIGADETAELGMGRTHDQVQAQGYGPVYMSFLKQIHDALAPLDRRLLFWGDIGDANPAAVPELPKDMIAVPWDYSPNGDFDKLIQPFARAGMETWVAPGDANWNEVYPVERNALWNIQGFIREGQRLGSTGALTTVWNDDGEGLFNMDWYGVLFGAVAAWQPGESSIADYQDEYGQVFHGDGSGKINNAEKELMAAEEDLGNAKPGMSSDTVFWLDPWSEEGQSIASRLQPYVQDLRTHAEQAIVLLEQVRASNPGLRETSALEAMDLGARRLDFIGMKFELGAQIAADYAQAVAQQHDKTKKGATGHLLEEISSNNGRCQDLRDAYSATRGEFSQVWLGENRPYWLNNVTVRYDLAVELWQRRGDLFAQGARDWQNGKDLPAPALLGLPDAGAH